jgi:hypothetical protein
MSEGRAKGKRQSAKGEERIIFHLSFDIFH